MLLHKGRNKRGIFAVPNTSSKCSLLISSDIKNLTNFKKNSKLQHFEICLFCDFHKRGLNQYRKLKHKY